MVMTALASLHTVLHTREPLRLGPLTLASRFWLAPLAGYTNLPFRLAVRELGGLGLATTDLVNARSLQRGSRKTHGADPDLPGGSAAVGPDLRRRGGGDVRRRPLAGRATAPSVIDINMGCPVHKVCKGGGGSAMMCDPDATVELVRQVVEAVATPGDGQDAAGLGRRRLERPVLRPRFEQVGVAGVIIHGRTRAQGFSGQVNLDGIRAVVEAVERIPVIGNGDVRSIADAAHMLAETGCAGIAIGRGALLNPWIFAQLDQLLAHRRPGPSAELSAAPRLHGPALPLAGRAARRALRLPDLPQGGQLVLPGAEAGPRDSAAADTAGKRGGIRWHRDGLRERGEPTGWAQQPAPSIAVPSGPIEHW